MVTDDHVDNYLKEILAFVYGDSFLNNRSEKETEAELTELPSLKYIMRSLGCLNPF